MSLAAQETAGAMLRGSGSGVFVNGSPAPASIALFRGDFIEISKDGVARLEMTGSTVDMAPQTTVEFDGDELVLDHGGLSVDSSRGLRVRIGCVTVAPVNDAIRTHYEVADVNGRVNVSSLTSDAYIDAQSKNRKNVKATERSQRSIVREGEQKSREDKCAAAALNGSGTPPLTGPLLNSLWARGIGGVAIGALTCWALCFQGSSPISPSTPSAHP
ncbi:MAG: hypothetical protein ACRD3B_18205 [Candidatus Sulfotelmatobacter sp.]